MNDTMKPQTFFNLNSNDNLLTTENQTGERPFLVEEDDKIMIYKVKRHFLRAKGMQKNNESKKCNSLGIWSQRDQRI